MSDPTNWSDERLIAHALEFCDLPLTAIAPVMSDEDTEAHGDILYMRGLLDELTAAKADLEKEAKGPDGCYSPAAMLLGWLCHSARAWEPLVLRFDTSWRTAMAPLEAVGEQIAAWREQLGAAA